MRSALFIGCGGSDSNQKLAADAENQTLPSGGGNWCLKSDTSVDLKSLSGTVKVDGSSTVYLVTEAIAEEFQKVAKVKVTVGISGTGGGFKKFCRGEIDVADASRPILKAEMNAAKEAKIEYIELPVCFDALTVAVNPANPLNSITVAELKKMWEPEAQGKVTRWDQADSAWPDAELTLYGAGPNSGTIRLFHRKKRFAAKPSRAAAITAPMKTTT